LELIDYRDFIPAAKFDKIVSIEMIEAVGDEYIPDYFKTINNCLLPNGLFVMQAITSPNSRYEQFKYGVDWIQKHIFPGSLLPSLQRLTEQASAQAKLDVMDLKDFGISYAKTLNTWRSRFWAKISEIDRLIPNPDFKRKWHFYLCYCEAAFSKRNISVVQILFSRPNNDTWSNESALKIEN
jgi:cyclopropane-fatty-acyl-phospholipid synthase